MGKSSQLEVIIRLTEADSPSNDQMAGNAVRVFAYLEILGGSDLESRFSRCINPKSPLLGTMESGFTSYDMDDVERLLAASYHAAKRLAGGLDGKYGCTTKIVYHFDLRPEHAILTGSQDDAQPFGE